VVKRKDSRVVEVDDEYSISFKGLCPSGYRPFLCDRAASKDYEKK